MKGRTLSPKTTPEGEEKVNVDKGAGFNKSGEAGSDVSSSLEKGNKLKKGRRVWSSGQRMQTMKGALIRDIIALEIIALG